MRKEKNPEHGGVVWGFVSFLFFLFLFIQIRKERESSAASPAQMQCTIDLYSTVRKTKYFYGKHLFSSMTHFFSHFVEKPSSLLVPLVARKPFWIAIHSRNGIYAARGKTQPVTPPNRHRQPRLKHDTHDDM